MLPECREFREVQVYGRARIFVIFGHLLGEQCKFRLVSYPRTARSRRESGPSGRSVVTTAPLFRGGHPLPADDRRQGAQIVFASHKSGHFGSRRLPVGLKIRLVGGGRASVKRRIPNGVQASLSAAPGRSVVPPDQMRRRDQKAPSPPPPFRCSHVALGHSSWASVENRIPIRCCAAHTGD